jgi:hypothetical protein
MGGSMKFTRFKDIPAFVRDANYQVSVSWGFLEDHLEHWNEGGNTPVITQPVFQRGLVWTDEQAIRYVEYILRGGPSARVIYWNCSSWMMGFNTPIELVDGQQRLNAVRRFLNSEFPAFGTLYKDFEDRLNLTHADFTFAVNTLKTRKEVFEWYLCLNYGGTPHTKEELDKVQQLIDAEKKK